MDKKNVTTWGNGYMQGRRFQLNLQHFADPEGGEGGESEKTYTQDELNKLLQSETDKRVTEALKTAKEKWGKEYAEKLEKEKLEAERLAKLSADERNREKLDKERKALEAERAQFEHDRLEMQVAKELTTLGLDAGFASFLMGEDAEGSMANINTFKEKFDAAVENAVKARLAGNPPSGSSGKKLEVNPFDADTFNLTEQARLLRENPSLYNELKSQAK